MFFVTKDSTALEHEGLLIRTRMSVIVQRVPFFPVSSIRQNMFWLLLEVVLGFIH